MIGLSGLGAEPEAIFVGGTILSPYTMQAYAAGGYSKSSFNNIHWDEKSARKWACYATAGQLAAMAFGGYLEVNAALVAASAQGNMIAKAWVAFDSKPVVGPFSGLDIATSHLLAYDIATGDWKGASASVTGYAIKAAIGKSVPIGLLISGGEYVGKTCEGPL
ncbi:hypothetical protein FH584_19520 (plasmid) [Leptospira interrogans]|uniref:hypothetical protein n=1 Tax=Leptospira interrogans TaxID=173 RepID=UPI001EEF8B2B|nr:hypothetical protein [Leptospira interrogans]ULG94527.1 hypothetical protein FH584_19815 [Leptospira interrogans]ULG94556.1 hypothetical protein FH584_19520 [Leptospira interrogans]